MIRPKRLFSLLGAVILVTGLIMQLTPPSTVHAAAPEFAGHRSLTLEDQPNGGGGVDGGSLPGGTVKHLFSFTLSDTTDNLGSMTFQYCTTAEAVAGGTGCIAPTGIDVSGATITANTGAAFTTVAYSSLDDASDGANNVLTISRSAATLVAATPTTVEFSGIVNPSTPNTTFYVRLASYSSTDGTGTPLEGGTVAASTASAIVLQGNMPESLVFCTGATISETSGVPDCTTATSGNIQFNQLFSPTSTAYATSQMAASTNAGEGYAITVGGTTLTSGVNTVKAMTTTGPSEYGVSQFGLNLVLNDGTAYTNAPDINTTDLPPGYAGSADVTPVSNGTNYNAAASTGFNAGGTHNGTFTFNDAALNTVASSDYSVPGTAVGTDSQIYTASYIVNVPGSQPAGTYTTTLTYICTPTF